MPIRDILLPLVGEPGPAVMVAIEKCVAMAAEMGARISAVAIETDIHVRPKVLSSADPTNVGGTEGIRSVTDAQGLLGAFEAAANRLGIRCDQKVERIAAADVAAHLAHAARLKDVSFVPVKPHDVRSGKIVEQLIFESGRPIVLCPEEFADRLAAAANNVAIAWNQTAPAARAVADALPYLQRAGVVRIFTATDKATAAELDSGAALVAHLAEHGIKASFETVKFNGSSVGKIFESYVRSHAIDLLVMGAYHHSRFNELLWGGASNTVIGRPPCWVLMAH